MNVYTQLVVSTVLTFAGLAAALLVLGVNLYALFRGTRPRWTPMLYGGVSILYGWSLLTAFLRQHSGLTCAMTPEKTLLLYGGLLLLHLYFLWDSIRTLRRRTNAS